jgi:hypothetical protein
MASVLQEEGRRDPSCFFKICNAPAWVSDMIATCVCVCAWVSVWVSNDLRQIVSKQPNEYLNAPIFSQQQTATTQRPFRVPQLEHFTKSWLPNDLYFCIQRKKAGAVILTMTSLLDYVYVLLLVR